MDDTVPIYDDHSHNDWIVLCHSREVSQLNAITNDYAFRCASYKVDLQDLERRHRQFADLVFKYSTRFGGLS